MAEADPLIVLTGHACLLLRRLPSVTCEKKRGDGDVEARLETARLDNVGPREPWKGGGYF